MMSLPIGSRAAELNGSSTVLTLGFKGSSERALILMGADPDKLLPFRFIDLDPLDNAFFSASFIFTYEPDIPVLFPLPLKEAAASTSLYAVFQLEV
jgi:hypothetical protein